MGVRFSFCVFIGMTIETAEKFEFRHKKWKLRAIFPVPMFVKCRILLNNRKIRRKLFNYVKL